MRSKSKRMKRQTDLILQAHRPSLDRFLCQR